MKRFIVTIQKDGEANRYEEVEADNIYTALENIWFGNVVKWENEEILKVELITGTI